jgi:hypothetical protein
MDKDAKEARDKRIFDLWLACWTQEEIAKDTGIDQGDLSKLTKTFMEIGNLAKNHKAIAEHATDFDPPIYNNREESRNFRNVSRFAGLANWSILFDASV